ncbi:MAG TPA: nucleotidyltransferase substrate binding protein [Candidatus Cloacimonadota bacterium]|nr:nucleotidyltransferase substrate binding protein [Candidatus Cloacimonadota bacterium]
MSSDIRWSQRYQNYKRALGLLEAAAKLDKLSDLETEGMIQRFEYTFELAWKTLKDFLEEQGFAEIVGSREAIRLAFANDIIAEGETWMDMIRARNLSTHLYDSSKARLIANDISSSYLPCFQQLRQYLDNQVQ